MDRDRMFPLVLGVRVSQRLAARLRAAARARDQLLSEFVRGALRDAVERIEVGAQKPTDAGMMFGGNTTTATSEAGPKTA